MGNWWFLKMLLFLNLGLLLGGWRWRWPWGIKSKIPTEFYQLSLGRFMKIDEISCWGFESWTVAEWWPTATLSLAASGKVEVAGVRWKHIFLFDFLPWLGDGFKDFFFNFWDDLQTLFRWVQSSPGWTFIGNPHDGYLKMDDLEDDSFRFLLGG